MRIALLAGLLCVFLPINANSQELPDVNWLISEVVDRAIRNDEIKKRHLQFTKEEITRDLNKLGPDGKGKIIGGQPPTPRGVGLPNDNPKLNPQDISTRYHEFRYSVPYIQTDEKGRKYYQISFKPKKENQDGVNSYVKGANRANGTMYIDTEYLYVVKLEAEMPESEAYSAWGVFTNKWFHAVIKQNRRPDLGNLVVIESVTSELKYSIMPILWKTLHYFRQYEYLYSNYVYIP